jgi:hypothetical protein
MPGCKTTRRPALIAILLATCLCAQTSAPFAAKPGAKGMPGPAGWAPAGEVAIFTSDNLWEHINGAADLFLSFGFQQLWVREIGKGGIVVAIEVYDMGSPLNAFGIFRSEKSGSAETLAIGAEAVISAPYQCQLLLDRFYLKVEAIEGDIDAATGRELLESLVASMPVPAGLPPELGGLPEAGRVPGSERYQRDGFMGLGDLDHCLYADYRLGDLSYRAFLMLPEGSRDSAEKWEFLAVKWEMRKLGEGYALLREIPYSGLVGLLRRPEHLLGIAGIESEDNLLQILSSLQP